MKYHICALSAAFAISACATANSYEMSEEAASALAAFERTGETDSCLPLRSIRQIKPLDERYFLVQVGQNQYYLNETKGRCSGADRLGYRLQYSTTLSQLCRSEIIDVVDNTTGFTAGSCGLGEFEKLEKIVDKGASQ